MRRALDLLTPALIDTAERRLLPDALVRLGIQRVVARRLETPEARDPDLRSEKHRAFVARGDAWPHASHCPVCGLMATNISSAINHSQLIPAGHVPSKQKARPWGDR